MKDRPTIAERAGLSAEEVSEFEIVQNQLERFLGELHILAKGKPNEVINNFKLSLLNNLLQRSNVLLGKRYTAVTGFVQFESELLPSISDALLVVSQYLGALEKLRTDNIGQKSGVVWSWRINGVLSEIRTPPPAKISKK